MSAVSLTLRHRPSSLVRTSGRILHLERKARYRHPRLCARVLYILTQLVQYGQNHSREDHELYWQQQYSLCHRRLKIRSAKEVCAFVLATYPALGGLWTTSTACRRHIAAYSMLFKYLMHHSHTIAFRQVPANEAEEFAKEVGASWVETSAKLNVNVGTWLRILYTMLAIWG